MTECGGCAAKLGADLLAEALSGLGAEAAAEGPDELIAGLNPPDDAAVYRVSEISRSSGPSISFRRLSMTHGPSARSRRPTPCPTSSRWAAASCSRFRSRHFRRTSPARSLTEIFAGASAKVREAGGTLAGGHTIRDAEPKYGLAVIGAAHPNRLLRKGGANPGDRLVLTKPLGTGVLLSGSRAGRTSENDLTGAIHPCAV